MASTGSLNEETSAAQNVAALRSNLTGRLGAIRALSRLATLPRGARLLSYALLGLITGVVLLVAAATLPAFFGYHTYVVYGGSMGAGLRQGSVAVSKPTSSQELSIGDVVTRQAAPDSPPVLHRIVDITIVDGERHFVTQGDANRTPDAEPIAFEGTGDRVVYSVPLVGYLLHYAGNKVGRLLLIGAPMLILGVMFVREKWRSLRPPHFGTGAEQSSPADGSPRDTNEEGHERQQRPTAA